MLHVKFIEIKHLHNFRLQPVESQMQASHPGYYHYYYYYYYYYYYD